MNYRDVVIDLIWNYLMMVGARPFKQSDSDHHDQAHHILDENWHPNDKDITEKYLLSEKNLKEVYRLADEIAAFETVDLGLKGMSELMVEVLDPLLKFTEEELKDLPYSNCREHPCE